MAALAPIPSASVSTTVMASPFVRGSERSANFTSCKKVMAVVLLASRRRAPLQLVEEIQQESQMRRRLLFVIGIRQENGQALAIRRQVPGGQGALIHDLCL